MSRNADYLQLYHLEEYLFGIVRPSFHRDGYLSAFDFFCIVIWKANRAKSRIAKRLLATHPGTLNDIIRELTEQLHEKNDDEGRLRVLVKGWDFLLPMASAILTVLYPERFTVYDVRVCESLATRTTGSHRARLDNLADKTSFDTIWPRYQNYMKAVANEAKHLPTLRDKDRYPWGKSFSDQLVKDVKSGFGFAPADGTGDESG